MQVDDPTPGRLIKAPENFIDPAGVRAVFSEAKFARAVWGFVRGALAGDYVMESWPGFWREVRLTRRKLAEKLIRRVAKAAPPTPWPGRKEP